MALGSSFTEGLQLSSLRPSPFWSVQKSENDWKTPTPTKLLPAVSHRRFVCGREGNLARKIRRGIHLWLQTILANTEGVLGLGTKGSLQLGGVCPKTGGFLLGLSQAWCSSRVFLNIMDSNMVGVLLVASPSTDSCPPTILEVASTLEIHSHILYWDFLVRHPQSDPQKRGVVFSTFCLLFFFLSLSLSLSLCLCLFCRGRDKFEAPKWGQRTTAGRRCHASTATVQGVDGGEADHGIAAHAPQEASAGVLKRQKSVGSSHLSQVLVSRDTKMQFVTMRMGPVSEVYYLVGGLFFSRTGLATPTKRLQAGCFGKASCSCK